MTFLRAHAFTLLIGVTILLATPFAMLSAWQGIDGLDGVQVRPTRFFHAGDGAANFGIFVHMIAGALVTVMALVQTVPGIRARWPRVHRVSGRVVVAAALATALGGLVYISRQGTIGGPGMSAGFALYGLCLGGAAAMTWRRARAGDYAAHRRWGLRLVWLAIGSWLYRVQYGLWVLATGGWGVGDAFDGPFDRFMFLGFFVPHLLALEWWLRRRPGHIEPPLRPR